MQAIKGISRVGWLVTGIVVALVLAPTAALAAGAVNSGASSSAAVVAAAKSTAPAPSAYETYDVQVNPDTCDTADSQGPTPTGGEAFVVQEVEVDTYDVSLNGTGYSNNEWTLTADTSAQGCGNGDVIMSGDTSTESSDSYPDLGDEVIPITPGYVVRNGTYLDALSAGISAEITITGYLIPASQEGPAQSAPDKSLIRHRP
jgi:hypothetical protein